MSENLINLDFLCATRHFEHIFKRFSILHFKDIHIDIDLEYIDIKVNIKVIYSSVI